MQHFSSAADSNSRLKLHLCSVYHSIHERLWQIRPINAIIKSLLFRNFLQGTLVLVHANQIPFICNLISIYALCSHMSSGCMNFSFVRKPILFKALQKLKKRADKCKHYFVLQPWQNPPSCSTQETKTVNMNSLKACRKSKRGKRSLDPEGRPPPPCRQ